MRSSLFEALPADLIRYISQYLHLNGPSVKLIEGEPSEEEKKAVTATNGPALKWDEQGNNPEYSKDSLQTPDLNTYHLLIDNDINDPSKKIVSIGFCKKKKSDGSLEYITQKLDETSPLLRYVREDLTHREYSKLFPFDQKEKRYQTLSQNRVLLIYFEKELKAAGGLTCHRLRNRTRLAAVSQNARAIMNARMRDNEGKSSTNQVVQQSILQELFKDLCEYESFHELDKARMLLERFPQLLLSEFSGDIVGCSPELTLHGFTIIQKAYLQGNWFFYEMALEVIEQSKRLSEEDKAFYKKNVLAQIKVADNGQLTWTLDNLLNKGVRIIDADTMAKNSSEEKRFIEEEIVERNGYHLIIKKEADAITSCKLGYCDPNTKAYMTHDISTTDPLFGIAEDLYQRLRHANDGYGNHHSHCFTRDHRDLALVKGVLDQLAVPTQLRQTATPLNFAALLTALEKYIQNCLTWSVKRRRDHIHESIYANCRLFPCFIWKLWMSEDFPWSTDKNKMHDFVTGKKSGAVPLYYSKECIHPLPNSLGDKFYAAGWDGLTCGSGSVGSARGWDLCDLLKSILNVESQKRIDFTAILEANLNQNGNRVVF